MALIAGDGERASELLDEVLANGVKDPDWHWLHGRACALCKDLDGAEAGYAAALDVDPHHAAAEKALMALRAERYRPVLSAWHLHSAGRLVEASHAFAAALHNRTVGKALHPEVWTGLGWCHYGLADPATAAWCFQQAVALAPQSAQARLVALRSGIPVVLLTLEPTDFDPFASVVLRGQCGPLMTELVAEQHQ
ncbi:MAG: hypothetical protein EXS14_06235 [Planctomycetes bacterium]|nr:hypothetical protein [Planctomycetota bacterium]